MNLRCHFPVIFIGKAFTCGINRCFARGHRHYNSLSRRRASLDTTRCQIFHHQKFVSINFNIHQRNFNFRRTLSLSKYFNQSAMGKKGKKPEGMYTPSFINFVVIGTGGPGTSRCLLLATEHSRYMFNCGEGCQRLILLDKRMRTAAFAKLTGVDNVFITQKSWDTVGGLMGIAMTKYHMNDQRSTAAAAKSKSASTSRDEPSLALYGPEGIEKITTMSRWFADQSYANIVKKTGGFEDSALKITPVVFYEKSTETNRTATRERSPSPKRSKIELSNQKEQTEKEAYGYLCKVKPLAPKINVEKCVDAGITIGPMVGQLQRGFSVTLDDGTVVHPSQVTDTPNSLDRAFLVIDCPSEAYLPSLEESPVLRQYRSHPDNDSSNSLCLVVHMTPADVLNSPFYRDWMKGFGTDTDHLIMNEEASSADVPRIRTYQARLNVVNADVFPMVPVKGEGVPTHEPNSSASLEKNIDSQGDKELLKHIWKASCGLIYTIRGKELGFHTQIDDFDLAALHEEIEIPAVKSELETLRQLLSSCPTDHSVSEAEYPKVVFLGTGSSSPSAYRAQSFILVHISEESIVILDCGEDSYGQLYRFYGPSEANNILRKVKAIFISHLHGDHHMGLVTLLRQRKKAFDELHIPFEPTIVSAPIQMRKWLRFYQNEIEQISHLFRCSHHQKFQKITDGNTSFIMVSEDCLLKEVGLKKFDPVEVIHSSGAHGLVMTLKDDFKLVYSGDTRPCSKLAEIGEDCDLLIHEATHDDSLLHLAVTAKHSTFSEAMEIGEKMKAKQIILTHFSQRYTHMIPFLKTVPSNVGIAFDNMQVSPKNMPWLSKFIPALTTIFDDKVRINIKDIQSRNNTS